MATNEKPKKSKKKKNAQKLDSDIPQKKSKTQSDEESTEHTDWDVDQYRTEYESEEHWELRKRFMEVHKDKFPEQRLVCLARVFTNMEFMGCRYPSETMRQVAELSKEVAKDFRKSRESRLKRTFVTASDAAEQRAKGRKGAKTQQPTRENNQTISANSHNRLGLDLYNDLPFGNFVVHLVGGRNCLSMSAQRVKMALKEQEVLMENGTKKIDVYLNDKFVASGNKASIREAKWEAFNQALEVLQKNCYSIKPNPLSEKIKIEKTEDNKVVCEILKEHEEKKLDESNKGYKIMKMMGWSGGGLGSLQQGREEPVR